MRYVISSFCFIEYMAVFFFQQKTAYEMRISDWISDVCSSDLIREWLKVLRKKNVAVLFATQSLADIASSSIAPAIIESCPQRILLPNDRAIEPQSREASERFGLTDRQIELVSRATPHRQYYLQSTRRHPPSALWPGPIAFPLCGPSHPAH